MKKLISLLLLFAFSAFIVTAQTTTEYRTGADGNKVIYFTVSAMTDSVGSYYSNWFDVSDYWNQALTNIQVLKITSSTAGACNVNISLQGRMVTGYTSTGVDIGDTIGASGTETLQAEALTSTIKYQQLRIEADGLASNRADAVIRVWVILPKIGTYTLSPGIR